MFNFARRSLSLALAAYGVMLMANCTTPDSILQYYWKRVPDANGVFLPTTQWGNIFLKDVVSLPSGGMKGRPVIILVGHEWESPSPVGSARAIAAAWISSDGQVWTRVNYWAFGDAELSTYMTAATRFKNKFVGVGVLWDFDPNNPEAATSAKAWTSVNGVVWNTTVLDGGVYTQWPTPWLEFDNLDYELGRMVEPAFGPSDVASSDDCIVAVGSNHGQATIWLSKDGESWSKVYTDQQYNLGRSHIISVVRIDNGFLAFGGYEHGGPAMWKSPNGRIWTVERSFPAAKWLCSAALKSDGQGVVLAKALDNSYWACYMNQAGNIQQEPLQVAPVPSSFSSAIRWVQGNIGNPLFIMSHAPDNESILVRTLINGRFIEEYLTPAEGELRFYGRRVVSLNLQPPIPNAILVGHVRLVSPDPLLEGHAHGAVWIRGPR